MVAKTKDALMKYLEKFLCGKEDTGITGFENTVMKEMTEVK